MNALMIRVAIYAACLAVAFACGWRVASWRAASVQRVTLQNALIEQRAQQAAQLDQLRGKLAAAERLSASTAIERNEGAARVEKLQGALAILRGRLTEPAQEEVDGEVVPVVRRTLSYRVCVNAAVTGSAASIAGCEAGGVPLTVSGQ